jgi:hypothetical protein
MADQIRSDEYCLRRRTAGDAAALASAAQGLPIPAGSMFDSIVAQVVAATCALSPSDLRNSASGGGHLGSAALAGVSAIISQFSSQQLAAMKERFNPFDPETVKRFELAGKTAPMAGEGASRHASAAGRRNYTALSGQQDATSQRLRGMGLSSGAVTEIARVRLGAAKYGKNEQQWGQPEALAALSCAKDLGLSGKLVAYVASISKDEQAALSDIATLSRTAIRKRQSARRQRLRSRHIVKNETQSRRGRVTTAC